MSPHVVQGPTRDDLFTVLFQKNGVRYVVVALPEDQPWLTDILTTWQFTDQSM